MATVPSFEDSLNLREQIARIDKMQAELSMIQSQIAKSTAEVAKIQVDTKYAPWQVVLTYLGAGAALLAAGAALLAAGGTLANLLLP